MPLPHEHCKPSDLRIKPGTTKEWPQKTKTHADRQLQTSCLCTVTGFNVQ